MLDLALDILSGICLAVGSFFAIVGGIGILRLPDFYSRIHGAGLTETMGAGLLLTGLTLQAGSWLVAAKLIMVLFFLLITSPTSAHALSKSALAHGIEPLLDPDDASPEG